MATPANNAAVLTNSFFLMEWSSSFFTVLTPVRTHAYLGSGDNDVDGAQFRPRTRFHCGGSPLVRSILGNQIFARDPWKSREAGAVQNR
jgi:hypothetical protein